MATMYSLFLGIFSFALWLSLGAGDRAVERHMSLISESTKLRQRIVRIAAAELGVREQTGRNDGERVEAYLAYTKLGKGYAWCAAFVSWCYGQAGRSEPRNPWSPALFPQTKRYSSTVDNSLMTIRPADLFGIYNHSAKRIDHVGLIKTVEGIYIISIEGNSGNAVATKRRAIKTIYAFANWLD